MASRWPLQASKAARRRLIREVSPPRRKPHVGAKLSRPCKPRLRWFPLIESISLNAYAFGQRRHRNSRRHRRKPSKPHVERRDNQHDRQCQVNHANHVYIPMWRSGRRGAALFGQARGVLNETMRCGTGHSHERKEHPNIPPRRGSGDTQQRRQSDGGPKQNSDSAFHFSPARTRLKMGGAALKTGQCMGVPIPNHV